jgi:hypothetical protein
MPEPVEHTPNERPNERPSAPDAAGRASAEDDRSSSLAGRVGGLLGGAADVVRDRAGDAVDVVRDRAGDAVDAVRDRGADLAHDAARRWNERDGARVRRVRRLGSKPLAYLYDIHPEARRASPREIGLKTIGLDEIAGTAVGGAVQRGGDFLPLKPFRSLNWTGRWQRLRLASDRLTILPPIDVVRFADRYWVVDGHNRVALGLYTGQVGIDANVVELVLPGARPSERPAALAPVLTGSRAIRTAGEGHRTSEFESDDPTDRRGDS